MPQPEGAQLNPSSYSPLLTSMAGGLLLSMSEFIADKIAPVIPVAAPSGKFNIWDRGDFMRRGGKKLANYEAPPIEGFSTSSGTFSVSKWGVAAMWTAQDLAEARAGGTSDAQLINGKVTLTVQRAALEREIEVATKLQTPGNWSTNYAGVASGPTGLQFLRWDNASSDPVDDVETWREYLRLNFGIDPNTFVLPWPVLRKLKVSPAMIDRIKYGGTMDRPTQVTEDQIRMLFGIDRIFVPKQTYNTAGEGLTASYSYIWSNTMWFGYVAPAPTIETPSAMYTFAWTGDTVQGLPVGLSAGAGPQPWDASRDPRVAGLFMRRFRQDRPSGEFVESELYATSNVTSASMGMTFTTPITP